MFNKVLSENNDAPEGEMFFLISYARSRPGARKEIDAVLKKFFSHTFDKETSRAFLKQGTYKAFNEFIESKSGEQLYMEMLKRMLVGKSDNATYSYTEPAHRPIAANTPYGEKIGRTFSNDIKPVYAKELHELYSKYSKDDGFLNQDHVYALLVNEIKTKHLNHTIMFSELPYTEAFRLNDILFDEYRNQMNDFMEGQDRGVSTGKVPRDVMSKELSNESHLSLAEYASLIHPESYEYVQRLCDFRARHSLEWVSDVLSRKHQKEAASIPAANQNMTFFDYNPSLAIFDRKKLENRMTDAFNDSIAFSQRSNIVVDDYFLAGQSLLGAGRR